MKSYENIDFGTKKKVCFFENRKRRGGPEQVRTSSGFVSADHFFRADQLFVLTSSGSEIVFLYLRQVGLKFWYFVLTSLDSIN